jgi:hypothetical protein
MGLAREPHNSVRGIEQYGHQFVSSQHATHTLTFYLTTVLYERPFAINNFQHAER